LVFVVLAVSTAFAQGPGLGKPVSETDVAAWDISILPDGTGLPPGSGTPEQGSKVFAAKCAVCHGENAKGGTAAALVGGEPLTSGIETAKTVANFWPYATTIFDFTRRAMPWPRPPP
jgi:cytochrome c